MSTESFDNSYLPKRMSIILYTKTNQYARKIYTPQMSIPTTSSSYVNFNPLVKINKDTFFREYNIKPNDTTALNNKIIDIFLNKQKFDELLNKIVIDSNKKELTIQESCNDKVISNNIKVTLDVLFKPGNVLEIDKKPYTINSYTWLDGDWLIYSNDLKKDQIEDNETKGFYGYRNRSMYENEREKKFTKKAYDQLSKEIPNCLKGDLNGKSLLEIGDGEIAKQQIKADIVSNEKKMDSSTIESFFTEENKKLTEKYLFLPFNLDYNVPSFLKDPISVSLFYLGYDFSKEIGNFPRLKKTFDELDTKKKELKELIDKISSRTGNTKTNDEEETNAKKKREDIQKEIKYFNTIIQDLQKILGNKNNIKKCDNNRMKEIINRIDNLLVNIQKRETPDPTQLDEFDNVIGSINKQILNCKTFSYNSDNILFNKIITSINNIIKTLEEKKQEYEKLLKSHERNNLISQYNSLNDEVKYIDKKKEYLTNCSETLELIKQKIEKQNQYLLLFIQFYKLLYEFKKKELADIESQINPDQIFFLKMMNQIILFDLTIYNTIYNDDGYKKRMEQTKGLIDQCIERIKKNNSIKNNIKDELNNKKNDLTIFESYKTLIYYTNYVVDMDFWKIFSSKTTDIKTILFNTLSKTIYNFYKYNELLGKAEEYASKLNNMKYSCFELIIIYSRINMISFLRKYTYDKYNEEFYEQIKDISSDIDNKNKYYLDLGLMNKYEKPDSSIKESYNDYLTSVKLLTPSISTNDIEKICLDSFNNVTNDTPFVNNITSTDYKKIIENFEYKNDNFNGEFKLIGYNELKCVDAIQNALNWYLCLENKTYHNEIIKLDENMLVDRIVEKYGINIMVIRNESGTLKIHTNREKYNQTLFIYREGLLYYTILFNNKVALFGKNDIPDYIKTIAFDNPTPTTTGGSQREDIEKLMNQSLLNNLLQKPSSSDKQKMLMNTLAYIVPIKLELYEGKDITVGKKVSMKCEENYSNIIKAWKTLFKINEENKKEPIKTSLSSPRLSQR